MEENFYLSDCDDDDVLSFGDNTFKVSKFRKAVNQSFGSDIGSVLSSQLSRQGVSIDQQILLPSGNNKDYMRWFNEGIDCEILNLGFRSWKKGKVRIKFSVEFYEEQEAVETPSSDEPDINEAESPLDDIRRLLNENSHQNNL